MRDLTDRERQIFEMGAQWHRMFGDDIDVRLPVSVPQIMLLAEVLVAGKPALEKLDLDLFVGKLREALTDLKAGGKQGGDALRKYLKSHGIEWNNGDKAIDAVREAAKKEFIDRMMTRIGMLKGTATERANKTRHLMKLIDDKMV